MRVTHCMLLLLHHQCHVNVDVGDGGVEGEDNMSS